MTTNDKEKRKAWDKKYREKHSDKLKESQKNYQESEKGKKNIERYRNKNRINIRKASKQYDENNPEKVKSRRDKYYKTYKGIATMLRKHDARRLGVKKSKLTWQIIEMLHNRDKECVYCGCELKNNINYDHINPFRPFNEFNIVRSCDNCNKDKSRANMMEWITFKGYKISKKLLDLYNKAYS